VGWIQGCGCTGHRFERGDAGKRVSQTDPLRALCGFESRLGNKTEGESLEERARLERASAGVSSLRGRTAAFLYVG
jgi:hypothetical protein